MLHPDDAARVQANVLANIEEGKRFSDQYRVILRDGSERVVRTRTMSFVDGNGHRPCVACANAHLPGRTDVLGLAWPEYPFRGHATICGDANPGRFFR